MEEQNNNPTKPLTKIEKERMWVSLPFGFLIFIFINSFKYKVNDFFGIIENPEEGFFDKFQHFDFTRITIDLLSFVVTMVGVMTSYFIAETLLILFTVNPTYRKYGGFVMFLIFGLSASQLWFTLNHGGDDIFSWKGFSSPYHLEFVCLLCLSMMFGSARLFFSGVSENRNNS
jgi:hypothetical protein